MFAIGKADKLNGLNELVLYRTIDKREAKKYKVLAALIYLSIYLKRSTRGYGAAVSGMR